MFYIAHDSVICYVGNAHAFAVNMLLKLANFSCIDFKGHDKNRGCFTNESELPSLILNTAQLERALTLFTGTALPETTAPTNETSTIACASCSATNAPSRCGRCKTTKYCSAVCQKAHWPMHKKTCVAKPDVEVVALAAAENKQPKKEAPKKLN